MKKIVLFSLLTLLSISAFGQKRAKRYSKAHFEKFPSYSEVIKTYYTENQYVANESYATAFGKKYDGWYVLTKDEKGFETDERLIWSAKSKKFKGLKTKGSEEGNKASADNALNALTRGLSSTFYKQYPVYGYQGYEDDVIELLGNEKDLSPELMDALARSYSSKATETIMPGQFGGKKEVLKFDETFNAKDFPKEKLNLYMEYMNKSIATFKILSEKHTTYQTIVGSIRTKYYNEYMTAYLSLRIIGQDKAASKYLIDDLYNDFQIKTAINTLGSCATNAILFTYGDNDTYQLIYAQDKLGIRTDVRIINTSLASLGRYINFIKEEYNILTTLDMKQYQADNNNYLGVKLESEERVNIKDFLMNINEDDNLFIDKKTGVRYFPNKNIYLKNDIKGLGYQLGISKRLEEDGLNWNLGKSYVLKGELFILDVIASDYWRSPVYFTLGSSPTLSDLGLRKYTQVEGLTLRLLPKGIHDFTLLRTNVLYVFKYSDASKVDWYSSENAIYAMHYFTAFKATLDYQINHKGAGTEDPVKTLDKLLTAFPLESASYKYFSATFATTCYDLELPERGDAFIKAGVQEVHGFFKTIENETSFNFYEQQNINWFLYTADQITTTADINNRSAFKDLETEFKVYFDKYGQ